MHPFCYRTVLAGSFLVLSAALQPALARQAPDPLRFVMWTVDDAVGIVGGVSYPEVLGVAGAGLVVFGVSRFDRDVARHTAPITDDGLIRVAEEFGNPRVVLPMSIVVFTGALLSGDARFQEAAFTSIEALLFANAVTLSLKLATGRARPGRDLGPGSIEPFSGKYSFPSGHATTAFAVLTPWYLYYPGPATAGLLVVAGATAFSRMAANEHWLSDVVAGSAIGFATAYVLARRHIRLGPTRVTPALSANTVRIEIRF